MFLFCSLFTASLKPASATVFDVNSAASTNTGSGTSGTLLYCISQANQSAGPHTINFRVAGTISVSPSSLPALSKSITMPWYQNSYKLRRLFLLPLFIYKQQQRDCISSNFQ